jgi:hypothetical protein
MMTRELPPRRSREEIIEDGIGLGLPREWLENLPKIEELPGRYEGYGPDGDAFLVWKAQEHLVRTGRTAEADPMLLAEALEDEAASDGPEWLHNALKRVMFVMAWPRRTYHLKVELGMALDHLCGCLEDAPSMWVFLEKRWRSTWSSAQFKVMCLDDRIEPPDECPWATIEDLFRDAERRLAEDRQQFP